MTAEANLTFDGTTLDINNVATGVSEDAISIGVDGEYDASIKFYDDDAEAAQHYKMTFNASTEVLRFQSDSVDNVLSLNAGGLVSIGVAPVTANKFYVYTNTDNGYVAQFNQDHATGYGVLIDTDATLVGDPAFHVKNATTTLLYVGSDGNIGIGITVPLDPLHVVGNIYSSARVQAETYFYGDTWTSISTTAASDTNW